MFEVLYGLNERVVFEQLEHATIFTLGLTAKGESYTIGKVNDL